MFKPISDISVRIWKNRMFRHLFYWICVLGVFYGIMRPFEPHLFAMKLSTFFTVSGPIPVYLHFFILGRYFERRKYPAYVAGLVIVIVLSAAFSEYVFRVIEKDPDSHSSGLGIAILFIVASTGFRYYGRGVRQQYLLQEVEYKRVQAELALLKSQINPHFFFNTLNSLYSLSLDKSDHVPGVILKLSELMRYVLDSSQKKTVLLEDELRFVENYIELEKLRLSGTPDIRIQVSGNLKGVSVPPMLLIPFVENGFKHGMSNSSHGGYIYIVSDFQDEILHFAVENSKGEGIIERRRESKGVGLANVTRRLELLYPDSHQLSFEEDENTYKVELNVRL